MAEIREYVIRIQNEIVNGNTGESVESPSTPINNNPSPNDTPISSKGNGGLSNSVGKMVAINFAKQGGQFILSNYGNLTGDYLGQTNLQEALEISGLVGMALTGPMGAAAVLGTVLIKATNRETEIRKSEITSAYMRERVGLSRGGNR